MARREWVGQRRWLRAGREVGREVGECKAVERLLLVSADCDRSWRDWSVSDCCITARRRWERGHGMGMGWGDSRVRELQRRRRWDRSSTKSICCRTSPRTRRMWKLHISPLQSNKKHHFASAHGPTSRFRAAAQIKTPP